MVPSGYTDSICATILFSLLPSDATMLTKTQKGLGLVLTAGFTWGMLCLFVRPLGQYGLSSMDIASVRLLGATVILAVPILFTRPQVFKVKLKDLWCMAGCGIASITMCNVCYFATMQRTTVNIAVVLLYTSPAFVTILSRLIFKDKLNVYKYLALFCVLLGCCLVAGIFGGSSQTRLTPAALLIGISSGLAYGLLSIFGRMAQNLGYTSITFTVWSFIFAAIASLFLVNGLAVGTAILHHPVSLILILGIGLVGTVVPYWTYAASLQYIQPSSAAIIASIEPIIGTLLSVCLLDESLSFTALLGMFFCLAACILCLK